MSLGDEVTETAALRATAHPVRLRIMSLLTGAPLTAADVARELGLTHANASYHLRNLLAAGMIVPAGEERIRGGMAKRYRYDAAHDLAQERARGRRSDAHERALYKFATALVKQVKLPDAEFAEIEAAIGRAGVAEVLVLLGYYTSVALGMKVHEVPIPQPAG